MWVSKVYRQHNSMVVTLKGDMCRQFGITHGCHLGFEPAVLPGVVAMHVIEGITGKSDGANSSELGPLTSRGVRPEIPGG